VSALWAGSWNTTFAQKACKPGWKHGFGKFGGGGASKPPGAQPGLFSPLKAAGKAAGGLMGRVMPNHGTNNFSPEPPGPGGPEGAPFPSQNIWRFLGIPQATAAFRRGQDSRINRNGDNPDKERKPPLKLLADPLNLESPNPAIKIAAEIKMAEDMKQQKIKAIKYLASIGCGCYKGVDEALLAAMDDCTEEVRYEAVAAISKAAGENCKCCASCEGALCNSGSCCSSEIRKKLREIVYAEDDDQCPKESSARVRAAAAQALTACGPEEIVTEETDMQPVEPPSELPPPPPAETRSSPGELLPPQDGPPLTTTSPSTPSRSASFSRIAPREEVKSTSTEKPVAAKHVAERKQVAKQRVTVSETKYVSVRGRVTGVDAKQKLIRLRASSVEGVPRRGDVAHVYHRFLLKTDRIGSVQIVGKSGDELLARPRGDLPVTRISAGDSVVMKCRAAILPRAAKPSRPEPQPVA
ncbi:MAG: hypothetical protein N2C14_06940, partial [Planctomycetales bacterium]